MKYTIELGGGKTTHERQYGSYRVPSSSGVEIRSSTSIEDAKEQLRRRGRKAWRRIHSYRGCERQYVELWEDMIPGGCSCEEDYRAILKQIPFNYDSPDMFFESAFDVHNAVNEKIGSDRIDIDLAYALWRDVRIPSGRKRAVITVATGTEFLNLLKITGPCIRCYAEYCDADYIPITNGIHDFWGMEKFRAKVFAKQYSEVLFLDADCIPTRSAPDLFSMYKGSRVAVHDDFMFLNSREWLTGERKSVSSNSGRRIDDSDTCLNSGVVYCETECAKIWDAPEVPIGKTHCAEQIWFEQNVREGGSYSLLDDRANWQWYFSDFVDGLSDAWVIHLANAPDRLTLAKKIVSEYGIRLCG